MSPSVRALLLIGAIIVPGCISMSGDPIDVREYDLFQGRAGAPRDVAPTSSRLAIEVERFTASEVLDRPEITWRRSDVEVGSYSTHRWARPPEQAVREAMAAAVRESLPGFAVATDPELPGAALVLRGHLARCEELDHGDAWFGAVELRVVLVGRDGRELLRRTYSGEERARARNPLECVSAMQRVVTRIGGDLARDVGRSLEGRSTREN